MKAATLRTAAPATGVETATWGRLSVCFGALAA